MIGGFVSAAVGAVLIGAPPWLLLSLMAIAGMAAGERIALAGRCASSAASTRRFPACCWPISPSP